MSPSTTLVSERSTIADSLLPTISVDTSGSSETAKISGIVFEASVNTFFTSSTVVGLASKNVKSEIEPTITGTLSATPSNLPARSGIASVVAIAAPVVVGMMLTYAALALRKSCALPPGGGPSTRFCSAVTPWIVVIIAFLIPNFSCITLATGATQFVVQEALLITSSPWYFSSLTPKRNVGVSLPGAEITIFLPPAVMCLPASSFFVNRPVDSITTSIPKSFHGSFSGSFSERTLTLNPSI